MSPACDNCYAENRNQRFRKGENWGAGAERRMFCDAYYTRPAKWQLRAQAFFEAHGRRRTVFPSLCDPFDNAVPNNWRDIHLWQIIRDTPDLIWMLLTKRPQNIAKMKPDFWDEIKDHVWLGATCEDQKRADINIPHLLEHDADVRFISIEPMLGSIDLNFPKAAHTTNYPDGLSMWDQSMQDEWFHERARAAYIARTLTVEWVIAGGESGPNARPSHPDWFISIWDQCAKATVPFLFKQWGEWKPFTHEDDCQTQFIWPNGSSQGGTMHQHGGPGCQMARVGKKKAGRLLDGVEHNGFPKVGA